MFLIGHLSQGPLHLQARGHRRIMADQVSCIRFYFSKMFTDRLKNVVIKVSLLVGLSCEEISFKDIHVVGATLCITLR